MRFDGSSAPYSVWGDAPPSARSALYGPELPELLLSDELAAEAQAEPDDGMAWQETEGPGVSQESFFDAYADWPSEPAEESEPELGEPYEATLDQALAGDEEPEADLFADPAPQWAAAVAHPDTEEGSVATFAEEPAAPDETFIASSDAVQPEFVEDPLLEAQYSESLSQAGEEADSSGEAVDAPDAGAPADIGPDEGFGAESWAGDSEAYVWPEAESRFQPVDTATESLFSDAESAKPSPVLPPQDQEIGSGAQEADWPSTPPAISAGLDSFGEPEEEDEAWPRLSAEEDAEVPSEEWNEANGFDPDEDEEDVPILDTTLGAFRDYAREYTGGDDGEEEEEEEEEDDSTSSFGSLLGMTVRRRAADEPIELVGFDGETVAMTDAEIQFPEELEIDPELDSPLVVRRRMGGT